MATVGHRRRACASAGAARAACASCLSCCSRCVTRSLARRRPISSFVSPGPRPPMPPVRRESESSFWARRGRLYLSCASSTWSLPSPALGALGEDVEDELRAVDDLEVASASAIAAGLRGRELAIEDQHARRRAASRGRPPRRACPCPGRTSGSMRSRIWRTTSATSVPAVRASSRSSRMLSSARRARRCALDLSPTCTRIARPSFARDVARPRALARTRPRGRP